MKGFLMQVRVGFLYLKLK